MPQEPQISGMPKKHRQIFFWGLVFVFVVLLPTMIFYTTGYRLSFDNNGDTMVTTTGGMYVTTPNLDVDVYLDEEQIERPRLFRSAYYIQNIDAGQHRIVVQAPDVHTWVKDLPVDSHIVIEASAFNMPTTPRLRPITEFQTITGAAVYQSVAATSTIFASATATEPFIIATTSATSTYTINPEFEFVSSLFGTSTATTTSVFTQFLLDMDRFRFMAPGEEVSTTGTTSLPVIERNDVLLSSRGLDLYAVWQGREQNIPFYFCVTDGSAASTSARYGQHVADTVFTTPTATSSPTFFVDDRICRSEIKLDRLRQDVYLFDFFPGSSDLVLLHLEDGLFVTEIDDRAWQNTQPLYLGSDFQTIIENDVIYIKEAGRFFEIIPEIES
jgi:hypothetical protein